MLEAMQMEALEITSYTDFERTPEANLAYRGAIRRQMREMNKAQADAARRQAARG